jgi:hypothetical protein
MRRLVSSAVTQKTALRSRTRRRYLFALDFHDPDLYVSTFTEDGVLDYGSDAVKGREAIKAVIAAMPKPAAAENLQRGA